MTFGVDRWVSWPSLMLLVDQWSDLWFYADALVTVDTRAINSKACRWCHTTATTCGVDCTNGRICFEHESGRWSDLSPATCGIRDRRNLTRRPLDTATGSCNVRQRWKQRFRFICEWLNARIMWQGRLNRLRCCLGSYRSCDGLIVNGMGHRLSQPRKDRSIGDLLNIYILRWDWRNRLRCYWWGSGCAGSELMLIYGRGHWWYRLRRLLLLHDSCCGNGWGRRRSNEGGLASRCHKAIGIG